MAIAGPLRKMQPPHTQGSRCISLNAAAVFVALGGAFIHGVQQAIQPPSKCPGCMQEQTPSAQVLWGWSVRCCAGGDQVDQIPGETVKLVEAARPISEVANVQSGDATECRRLWGRVSDVVPSPVLCERSTPGTSDHAALLPCASKAWTVYLVPRRTSWWGAVGRAGPSLPRGSSSFHAWRISCLTSLLRPWRKLTLRAKELTTETAGWLDGFAFCIRHGADWLFWHIHIFFHFPGM